MIVLYFFIMRLNGNPQDVLISFFGKIHFIIIIIIIIIITLVLFLEHIKS